MVPFLATVVKECIVLSEVTLLAKLGPPVIADRIPFGYR